MKTAHAAPNEARTFYERLREAGAVPCSPPFLFACTWILLGVGAALVAAATAFGIAWAWTAGIVAAALGAILGGGGMVWRRGPGRRSGGMDRRFEAQGWGTPLKGNAAYAMGQPTLPVKIVRQKRLAVGSRWLRVRGIDLDLGASALVARRDGVEVASLALVATAPTGTRDEPAEGAVEKR